MKAKLTLTLGKRKIELTAEEAKSAMEQLRSFLEPISKADEIIELIKRMERNPPVAPMVPWQMPPADPIPHKIVPNWTPEPPYCQPNVICSSRS